MKEIPAKIAIFKHHERIFNIETLVLSLEGYSHLCPFLVVGTEGIPDADKYPRLGIFKNEISINTQHLMKTFGERHRYLATATHNLAEL